MLALPAVNSGARSVNETDGGTHETQTSKPSSASQYSAVKHPASQDHESNWSICCSLIGLPLQPSSSPNFGGDAPFNDDAKDLIDHDLVCSPVLLRFEPADVASISVALCD